MSVRLYKQGDEEQILSLFEKVFKTKMDKRVWHWKYTNTPNGLAPIILVFDENGIILGHTALWVHPVIMNGKQGKIGLRVDTMVDPSERGKGIYKQLSEHLIKEAEKENINLLYGFPAEKAKELQIKYIGAHYLTNVNRWVCVNRPIATLSTRFPVLRGLRFFDSIYSSVKRFIKHREKNQKDPIKDVKLFDSHFHFLPLKEQIHLKRNNEYLNWRYAEHPKNNYKILQWQESNIVKGYIVYRVYKHDKKLHIGLIIDLIAFGKHSSYIKSALLQRAINNMNEAAYIQAWTMPNQEITNVYKKLGFFMKDEPMPIVIKDINCKDVDVKDPNKWFISMGDVDSF